MLLLDWTDYGIRVCVYQIRVSVRSTVHRADDPGEGKGHISHLRTSQHSTPTPIVAIRLRGMRSATAAAAAVVNI